MILLNILGSGYRLAAEPVETQDGYLAHLVRVNRNATVDSPDSGNGTQDRLLFCEDFITKGHTIHTLLGPSVML